MLLRFPQKSRHRQGLTLTEVAIVTMIMGVVLSGLWVAVDAVYAKSRLTTTHKQILVIVNAVRSLYGQSRSHMLDMAISGTTGASLVARLGAVPEDMLDRGSTPPVVVHMWKSKVTFDAAHQVVDGDSFVLGLQNVPAAPCAELLVRMTGADRDAGLISAGTATGVQTAAELPIGLVKAVEDCSSDLNTVEFTFMLKV